jgi:hypothetical protein
MQTDTAVIFSLKEIQQKAQIHYTGILGVRGEFRVIFEGVSSLLCSQLDPTAVCQLQREVRISKGLTRCGYCKFSECRR